MAQSEINKSIPGNEGHESNFRDTNIYLQDGRVLLLYRNGGIPDERSTEGYIARHHAYLHLSRRGVIELPERQATDIYGKPLPGAYAIYIDERIGYDRMNKLIAYERRMYKPGFDPHNVSPIALEVIAEVFDRGIEETGIGELLEQMRAEDSARTSQAPELDINAIMRNMRDQLR